MDFITHNALRAQVALTATMLGLTGRLRRDDRGQGSVEYVGIILAVVVIVAVVAGAKTEIGNAIKTQLINAINTLGGS